MQVQGQSTQLLKKYELCGQTLSFSWDCGIPVDFYGNVDMGENTCHRNLISVNLRAAESDTVNLTAGDCAAAIYQPSRLMLASGTQPYKGLKTEDSRNIAGSWLFGNAQELAACNLKWQNHNNCHLSIFLNWSKCTVLLVFSKGTTKRWNISSRFLCTWMMKEEMQTCHIIINSLQQPVTKNALHSEDVFSHNMDRSKLVTSDFEFVDFFFFLGISCHKTTGKAQEIKTYSFCAYPIMSLATYV